jgi:hypothetical protein
MSNRFASLIVATVAVLLLASGAARAQEYCVACSEPSAVYRCVIDNAQPGGAQPLQVLCITAMAKAGGHGQCAIKRGTVFDCNGPLKRVPWTGTAGDTPAPLAPPKPPEQAASDPKEPPKTVQELADRANKQTSEDVKKAGETFKDNAKKTFECVTSLFFKC